MSFQLIVRCAEIQTLQSCLSPHSDHIEIFSIDTENSGISVPEYMLEHVGEDNIRAALATFDTYDLYSGQWHPKTTTHY